MKKNPILIPIGGYYISDKPDEELITVAGSCVAVTVYDKTKQAHPAERLLLQSLMLHACLFNSLESVLTGFFLIRI